MEGQLLSRETLAGQRHAPLLRASASRPSRSTTPSTACRSRDDAAALGGARSPDDFRFVLKAPQRITHIQRLKDVADSVTYFFERRGRARAALGPVAVPAAAELEEGPARGCEEFLGAASAGAARGLRVPPRVLVRGRRLRDAARARRGAVRRRRRGGGDEPPFVVDRRLGLPAAAATGLLRERDLAAWARSHPSQTWSEAFVFFKHEDEGKGPKLAARFIELDG